MIDFIIKNKFIIFFAILGLIAGFLLNKLANKLSEDRIIAALTAEIESLKNKQKTGRTTDDQQKINLLQAQIQILKSKSFSL